MHKQLTSQETRVNQRVPLLGVLKARSPDWVPIREVVAIAAFRYGTLIIELRRLGHRIEHDPGRAFRLTARPAVTAESVASCSESSPESDQLSPDSAPLRHLDLG